MEFFRRIYDLLILIVIILGIIKLFQAEYYLAFTWIILVPLLMLLPRNLYKINFIKNNYNHKLVDTFEILILIILITSAGFTLGLKDINIDFDSFFHFLNSVIYTIITGIIYYIIRARNYIIPSRLEVTLFTFVFNLVLAVILWEKFQYFNDQIFGTKMFYDEFQNIKLDSFLDQVFGSIGTITGSAIAYNKIESWFKIWRK